MNHWLKQRENKSLSLYEVDDGEQHWYVAASAEEAKELHLEPLRSPKTGEVDYEFHGIDELEVRQMSRETVLPVRMIDEDDSVVKKTAAEWCLDGKGLVASTVY